MSRILGALRSPLVKWLFLAIALGLGVWAVWKQWDDIRVALSQVNVWLIVLAGVVSAAYVWCTMLSWRRILRDLGSPISIGAATELFGVSQIGKYIPGGVWNIVAAAEIGTAHHIPRRRSVTAMAIAVLVSLVSGLAIGSTAFLFAPSPELQRWGWVVFAAIPLLIALVPPVLNRLIAVVFRLTKRPPLETPLSTRGVIGSVVWALIGWALAGVQVWILVVGLGATLSPELLWLSIAGYALAWSAGFLFIVAPAGVGAREAVLAATLAGGVSSAVVLTVVLLSRVLLTLVDLIFAAIGLIAGRRIRSARAGSIDGTPLPSVDGLPPTGPSHPDSTTGGPHPTNPETV
ncbi:MAG: lysylphosphatidylglycerol synthase transmembrane domain-containing protein [Mycetocola sp.]